MIRICEIWVDCTNELVKLFYKGTVVLIVNKVVMVNVKMTLFHLSNDKKKKKPDCRKNSKSVLFPLLKMVGLWGRGLVRNELVSNIFFFSFKRKERGKKRGALFQMDIL